MALFKRPKPEPNQSRTSPALLDIAERMDRLERKIRDLETDWASQYDKFHRLNMRLAKRAKMLEEAEDNGNSAHEDAPGATISRQPISNPMAEILLRRGRGAL